MKRRKVLLLMAIAAGAGLVSMAIAPRLFGPPSAQANSTLLVSAAASLQTALKAIEPRFAQANPSVKLTYNFGSSGALQQQIEQGAPVDVFVSAAQKQMNALQGKGLILNGTRRNLLSNRLVLIVPLNSTLGLSGFRQLVKANKIAVGEPRSVPVGQYAEEVFKNLGLLGQLKSKLVFGNNVRSVLSAVESGNVDAGVVYRTDAKLSNRIKQAAIAPTRLHSPIIYPVAVLKGSKNAAAAKAYVQFLSSDAAKTAFRAYGFGTP
ncbi:molybdate ABC transporter substrate-binding protein [Altericista sp. CCNU0014]|uniref:molybdate ABC transporter substrate-binding protein n=1 Tax=Altericista sp. CCNU0014 TaxID=3082949 RepID=UPI0038515745